MGRIQLHPATIFGRGNAGRFFESGLEMALAGKAQVIADGADGFVCAGQKLFGFINLALCDESLQGHVVFLLEEGGKIAAAVAEFVGQQRDRKRLIDVLFDVTDQWREFRVVDFPHLDFSHTIRQFEQNLLHQMLDRLAGTVAFDLLDEAVR